MSVNQNFDILSLVRSWLIQGKGNQSISGDTRRYIVRIMLIFKLVEVVVMRLWWKLNLGYLWKPLFQNYFLVNMFKYQHLKILSTVDLYVRSNN